MKNKISAIIIDPHCDEHDYTNLKVDKVFDTYEDGFDFVVLKNTDDIMYEINKFGDFDTLVTIGEDINFNPLNNAQFEIRKRWIHFESFDARNIAYGIINNFKFNINRKRGIDTCLFSFFTSTYNTDIHKLNRLYNSLKAQTYNNWNWWVIDDSTNPQVIKYLTNYNDPRINVICNVSKHGNIGYNKHIIAMACDGEFLVEVDHDDELTANCLEKLKEAFEKYPDADFAYSHTLELENDKPISYGEPGSFACGFGDYKTEVINGKEWTYSISPDINSYTIRLITAQPNHVRCWKKDFYHKIGGHDITLSVLDDQEILIRTFLYGKMVKINSALYIQYEYGDRGNGGTNTQSTRFNEIQRTMWLLKEKYDSKIHKRVLELGGTDPSWNDEYKYSDILRNKKECKIFNYILD